MGQYADLFEDDAERVNANANVRFGIESQPDLEAQKQALAKRYDVPAGVVDEYRADYETRAKTDDAVATLEQSPKLRSWLAEDANRAKVVHDDLSNLSFTEKAIGALGDYIVQPIAKGTYQTSGGLYGATAAVADLPAWLTGWMGKKYNPFTNLADWLHSAAKSQLDAADSIQPWLYDGTVSQGFQNALSSVQSSLMTAGAGAEIQGGKALTQMGGFVAPELKALLPIGAVTGGQSYQQATDAGLPGWEAALFAAQQGGVEMVTEALPLGEQLKMLHGDSSFLKTLGRTLIEENVGEQVATHWQDLNEWLYLHPEKTLGDYLAERPDAALQTALATTFAAGLQTGTLHLASRRLEKAAQAEQTAQTLQQLNTLAQESKVNPRAADTYQQLIAHMAESGGAGQVFVDADALMQSGIADKVAQVSPSVAAQLPQALQTKGQVAIPLAEYQAKIAPTEYAQSLLPHLKVDPEGFSQQEAQAYMQSHAEQLKTDIEQAVASVQGDDAFQASRERVKQTVLDQMNTAGRFTPAKNEADATLIAAHAAVRAAQLGITPEEFHAKYPLQVQAQNVMGEAVGGDGLSQGIYRVIYRGTNASNEKIKGGISEGSLFASGSEKVAKSYAGTDGSIERIGVKPTAKILIEGSAEYAKVTGRKRGKLINTMRKGENLKTAADDVAAKAKAAGYDAIEFNSMEDLGIAIFNEDAFIRGYSESPTDPNILKQSAYHGSPHRFDKFDLSKIGTGEGAQAYGWGIYLADAKDVADSYRTTLNFRSFDIAKEAEISGLDLSAGGRAEIVRQTRGNPSATNEAIARKVFNASTSARKLDQQKLADFIGEYRKNAEGQLYAVDIPDDAVSRMLDWDKPLSEQPEAVKEALGVGKDAKRYKEIQTRLGDLMREGGMDSAEWDVLKSKAQSVREKNMGMSPENTGEDLYRELSGRYGGHSAASKYLQSLDIPGLRYLDQGSRGSAGEGTRNTVVWDQKLLDQISENMQKFYQGQSAARGSFSPSALTISLLKNADLSTFLHESGHFFFETDIDLASQLLAQQREGASLSEGEQEILKDAQALLTWHGLQGSLEDQLDQWHTMPFEEKRTLHERTAESFERYLFEGKAPSIELQPYFQRFRAWLLNVYKALKDFLSRNPEAGKLNDEVRGVFDRMLATTQEIKLAEQGRSMMPVFQTAEQAGMTQEEFAAYHAQHTEATNTAIQDLQAKGLRDMQWLHNAHGREVKRLQKQGAELRRQIQAEVRTEVMSQPVYQAWSFLTRKMTADDALPTATPANPDVVDPTRDSLHTAIAKLGGLNKDEVVATWGTDPADKPTSGVFGKPVWRKEGGKSIDGMAELLGEHGYLPKDEHGKVDVRDLEERFDAELRGRPQYSDQHDYDAEPQRAGDQVANPSALGAGRLSLPELLAMDLPVEVVNALKARRMVAQNGLHPDLVAEIIPGFTSGDELVRKLAAADTPQQEIEARTDVRMLEEHGELSSPEAIAKAADQAIHNDARARFVATEANALAKAVGKPKVLTDAAKQYAAAIVARKKVRELKPGQFASVETKAAKAADKAFKAGDTAQAAAEKRNQVINQHLTKATYDALDEVDAGLRYLRKFDKDIKSLDADYADQIAGLLERFDLRSGQSNKAVDRQKSMRSWVMQRLAAGEIPDIADSLLAPTDRARYISETKQVGEDGEPVYADDAERIKLLADYIDRSAKQSYKDMTVEAFRGLVENIKQIEHLGKIKNRLLTADATAELDAVKSEIADGIKSNALQSGKDVPLRDDLVSSVKRRAGRFSANHIRMSIRALVMDGGKDNGPMWRYFVRPANTAEEKQVGMHAAATESMHGILSPVLKNVSIQDRMLSGKKYDSLGTSLNWSNRFAILLNLGNEGNTQRLLSGGVGGRKGLTLADVMPVMSEFSKAELLAAQSVWDHFESYRPELAELERETKGKEPEWIEPRAITIRSKEGELVTLRGGYYPAVYDHARDIRAAENLDTEEGFSKVAAARAATVTRQSFVKQRADEVHGRPLLLTLDAMYSGLGAVIHDLSFRRYALDMTKLLNSKRIQAAMREHYGDESIRQLRNFVTDLVAGNQRNDEGLAAVASLVRKNVSMAGLGLNLTSWLQQPFGVTNAAVRLGGGIEGWGWVSRGILELSKHPVTAVRRTMEASAFMRNRPRTRFRELNEIRNKVQVEGVGARMAPWMMWGMVRFQMIADVISWQAGYARAVANNPTLSEQELVSIADQVVRDSQGGGEMVDLSKIERGGALSKLFTTFFNFQNTGTNLAYLSAKTKRSAGKRAVDMVTVFTVPVLVGMVVKSLAPGGGDDDKDLAKEFGVEQLTYLAGSVAFVREANPAFEALFGEGHGGYQGPTGLRAFVDLQKAAMQAHQGEFDDAFRKASVNLVGDLFGLPSAQINRTITGVKAVAEGKTDGPVESVAAPVFGFQSAR